MVLSKIMLKNTIFSAITGRQLMIRNYARRSTNPGIENRLQMFKDDKMKQSSRGEEFEDDFEPDFQNVHKSHKQYEKEAARYRDNMKKWIVGNKYFKSKELNFLTWSEKEQMRYLNQQDPEEWTPEKLSESFPATKEIIIKVLKSSWTFKDPRRIEKHDESVKRSWKLLQADEVPNMNPQLREHLMKFQHRDFATACLPKVDEKKIVVLSKPPISDEFSSIITSCKKYADVDSSVAQIEDNDPESRSIVEQIKIPSKRPETDMFLIDEVYDKKPTTFKQIKEQINSTSNKSMSSDNQSYIPDLSNPNGTGVINLDKNNFSSKLIKNKYDNNLPDIQGNNMNLAFNSEIKEHIKIPKRLWREGATYKVRDCFYDDDGTFLYRVPGMTEN